MTAAAPRLRAGQRAIIRERHCAPRVVDVHAINRNGQVVVNDAGNYRIFNIGGPEITGSGEISED